MALKTRRPKDTTFQRARRAIVSKAGSAIGFMDDKKGSIFVETAGKAKILVDDEKKPWSFLIIMATSFNGK